MFARAFNLCFLLLHLSTKGTEGMYDSQGVAFLVEPPNKVEFLNTVGGRIDCLVRGNPPPTVVWLSSDQSRVNSIPSIRHLLENGSIFFPPFEADLFRQDVHWAIYRCMVSNTVGTIVSRDVVVRAVVRQRYEPEVQSQESLIHSNVLLRCIVPSFVKDHVTVTSWLQEPAFNIYPSTISDGKYHMIPSGELLIINISVENTHMTYKCRTHHRLTQEVAVSTNIGRIRLLEKSGKIEPAFQKKLVSTSVREDDVVVVPCVAEGNPPPIYRWSRKTNNQDRLINETDRMLVRDGTLVISHVRESDSGVYVCQASNQLGSDTLEVHISVNLPLTVHIHPPTQTLHLGQTAQLECNIHGFPKTSVVWLKDGQPLHWSGRIRLISDTKLQIMSGSKEDKGMYQCLVKNDIDMSQGSAEVLLGEVYPQLAYRFIEQTMQPGPSVSLKCSANGNPTPHITWLLDGYPLPPNERLMIGQYVTVFGDVVSHVNISSVKSEDAGEYECVAANRAGEAKHSARLNIYGLPFVRHMPPITAVAEKILHIKCPVAGYPVATIVWEKDGVRLPTSLRQRVENNSLIVENVQRDSDQGSYTCIARNKQGHSSQGAVSVEVVIPPKLTSFSFPRDLKLGDRISVQCLVVSGDEPLRFLWLKNGEPPSDVDGLTIRNIDPYTSSLSISAISRGNSGNYTCRASNQVATVSHTATLNVNVPPRISPFYFDEKVTTGMRTEVMCSASSGDLPINITWTKDGGPIKEIEGVRISDERSQFSSILTITEVTPRHSGKYTCKIGNAGGFVSRTASLSVTVPPYWVKEPNREQSVILGNQASLHCQAEGFPKPAITWKIATGLKVRSSNVHPSAEEYREVGYGTSNVVKADNGTLTLLRTTEEDEGYYMCAANNGVGAGKSTFIKLMVHAGPRFTQKNRQETVRKGETVFLRCEAEGDQPIDINWRVKGSKIDTGYDVRHVIRNTTLPNGILSELTIMEANHQDKGSYLCVATNPFGQDHSSIMLSVQEPPSFPRNLHVTEQSSRSVRLSWSPPTSMGDPKVDSYIIEYKEARDDWHERSPRVVLTGETNMATIKDLKPATMYHFRIYAENQLGVSAPSDVLHGVTEGEAPSGAPKHVSVLPLTSTEVQVTWQPPDRSTWNGELTGYNVGLKKLSPIKSNVGFNWTHVRQTSGGSLECRLDGLAMFTKYSVVVTASNSRGDGPPSDPVVVQTKEGVPNVPPQDFQCSSMTSQSIQMSWRPPPAANTHGLIQGYRVIYTPSEDWYETSSRETKVSASLSTTIHGLKPYTNYSVQVVAFTRAGDGARTPLQFCITDEAVPEAPAAVKAVISGKNAVTLSWLPPREPNGILTNYVIHIRKLQQSTQLKTLKVPAQNLHHKMEVNEGEMFEAWVSASTKVGMGHNTNIVQVIPSAVVPAGIISFGREILVPWKTEVRLACLYVGQGVVDVAWKFAGIVQKQPKLIVLQDKTLYLKEIERSNEGNYSCHARNKFGSDHIIYSITVQVPPTAPLLLPTAITTESVLLQWKQGDNGGSAVRGFLLSYKEEGGELKTTMLEENSFSYKMEGLKCGTLYQFSMTAYNKIGGGTASKWKNLATKGSRPIAPSRVHFLTINSSSVTLHLGTWGDGGCVLSHFSLGYRQQGGDWIKVSDNIQPLREYQLHNLLPSTEYVLKVGAHNNAGATEQEYGFVTLPQYSGPNYPNLATFDEEGSSDFSGDAQILVLGVGSIISLIMAIVGVCVCLHRRPEEQEVVVSQSHSNATLENKRNLAHRDQFYSTTRKSSQSRYLEAGQLERIPEHAEDIHPYATFHLPGHEPVCANSENQTYLCDARLGEFSDLYGKTKSGEMRRNKSKTSKSESEEYDSLGSESEAELDCSRTEPPHPYSEHSPLNHEKRRRGVIRPPCEEPRLVRPVVASHSPHHSTPAQGAESSTSTEPSPISKRRRRSSKDAKKRPNKNGKDSSESSASREKGDGHGGRDRKKRTSKSNNGPSMVQTTNGPNQDLFFDDETGVPNIWKQKRVSQRSIESSGRDDSMERSEAECDQPRWRVHLCSGDFTIAV